MIVVFQFLRNDSPPVTSIVEAERYLDVTVPRLERVLEAASLADRPLPAVGTQIEVIVQGTADFGGAFLFEVVGLRQHTVAKVAPSGAQPGAHAAYMSMVTAYVREVTGPTTPGSMS